VETGIIYIAIDRHDYLSMAIASALTLRSLGESAPIVIYSDLLPKSIVLPERIAIERILCPKNVEGFRSRWLKTFVNRLSPFHKTLFLDADIVPLRPIDDLWEYEGLAMALAYRPTIGECDHISPDEYRYTLARLSPSMPQFNSGVIRFDRSTTVDRLFECWRTEWRRFGRHDQLALARAIAITSPPNLLPQKFNQHSTNIDINSVLGHFSGENQKPYFWQNIDLKISDKVNDICRQQLPTT
jgi:hypothetical protein